MNPYSGGVNILRKSDVQPLLKALAEAFEKEIATSSLPRKTRDGMAAGFYHGARSMLIHLQTSAFLIVEDDTPETKR